MLHKFSLLQMLSQYKTNENITKMVDAFDWYIVPVFNVDGYVYTWETVCCRFNSINENDSTVILTVCSIKCFGTVYYFLRE